VTQSRAARRQIPDALACYNSDHRHAESTSSTSKPAKRPQRINWRLPRIRLARLPQPPGLASSDWFVLFLPLSSQKQWCSALCLAFLHILVRSANPSSAAQVPRPMSKHAGADPARFAPQPAPQMIRVTGAACAVAMQTPAGTERRAARMLPNIDRGKWGQHLYQIRSAWQSRASAQTEIWSSPRCVDSAVRFSASMSWTAMAPSHPGRTSQAHQQKPWVSQPPPRPLLLRPRSPPVAQTHILKPRRNGDAETGRSHTCLNPSVLTRLEGT
jgi:hypothetical protein